VDTISGLINDNVTVNGTPRTRDEVLGSLLGFVDAAPDFTWHVENVLASAAEGRIIARLRDTGTPVKQLFGVEPTGASIDITEFTSYRVENGRFTEFWFLMDVPSAIEQLKRG
jgi:predicted ester cyclase